MATIYAAALNFAGTYKVLEPLMHSEPYKAPPRAPVLYIKPPSCRVGNGEDIVCPQGVPLLRAGGTLAVEIGRAARRVREELALEYIAGYRVVNDVSVPEASYFRPAIAQRCRDSFCPVSDVLAPAVASLDPSCLDIKVLVNGVLALTACTSALLRGVARLVADVTEFMTLAEGDLLLVGEPPEAPLVRVGDKVRVEIPGIGFVENSVVLESLP